MKKNTSGFFGIFLLVVLSLIGCGTDKNSSNTPTRPSSAGSGFSCTAMLQKGNVEYVVDGNRVVFSSNSLTLDRISGSPGSLIGSWEGGGQSGNGITVKYSYVITSNSVTQKALCTRGSEVKNAEVTVPSDISNNVLILKDSKVDVK